MDRDKLEQAEQHLHSAEFKLQEAEAEEKAAIKDIDVATREIEAALKSEVIHFMVDGEPYETERHELTPNEIIREFGGRDPMVNYLVQIEKGQKESYQGKGGIPIKMHGGLRFQVLSTGPMTVSDGRI